MSLQFNARTFVFETSGLSRAELFDLLTDGERAKVEKSFWDGDVRRAKALWHFRGRPGQQPPPGEWRTWLVMAGRGYGKTRTGAEWVRLAAQDPEARIAIVGATLHETRAMMVEGESGLLNVGPVAERPTFEPSNRRLLWPGGAEGRLYSADDPDSLRGGQHSHAWGDEIAKWPRGRDAWMNLRMGLRLGDDPRAVLTTTPRPVELVKALIADAGVAKTYGRTTDNRGNLAPGFVAALEESYGGSRLGRQELDGELIEDIEGALWTREMLERCRVVGGSAGSEFQRVVVAVDPPASSRGDACGIVAVGLGADGRGHVLADLTVERAAPEAWAAAVAGAAQALGADRIVAEANNGGDMVASVLAASGLAMPVKLVHAARGKSARAEPVAALYAAGRVVHVGAFPALEDQLCGMMAGGGYHGPGRSPDRADALVWALTELMLGRAERRPGIRTL